MASVIAAASTPTSENGQGEHQPAEQADGEEGCEYGKDDHGSGFQSFMADDRASTTTTARLKYSE